MDLSPRVRSDSWPLDAALLPPASQPLAAHTTTACWPLGLWGPSSSPGRIPLDTHPPPGPPQLQILTFGGPKSRLQAQGASPSELSSQDTFLELSKQNNFLRRKGETPEWALGMVRHAARPVCTGRPCQPHRGANSPTCSTSPHKNLFLPSPPQPGPQQPE